MISYWYLIGRWSASAAAKYKLRSVVNKTKPEETIINPTRQQETTVFNTVVFDCFNLSKVNLFLLFKVVIRVVPTCDVTVRFWRQSLFSRAEFLPAGECQHRRPRVRMLCKRRLRFSAAAKAARTDSQAPVSTEWVTEELQGWYCIT